ncbi:large exoprotein [Microbacterium sp. C7(2022)]|uniref:large exoprotein n=1 Tax=Microbacterium sp. C7(2022) TaxID=2992759 RepID=UPI00237B7459|nr:large exoprotein [Microbacterium sp. C7(2022)]MDE0547082.1 large exoprotein [Microbacterium sp. C7(2022)]
MGGQVWGGGVIVLVATLLWLVYLLPSWYGRRQYDAAERNAVRLNQALRVLAETSETPAEVHLELNARTAMAQQKLARQATANRERAALEQSRIDLEHARMERLAVRAAPSARQARARRRFRLALTVFAVVSVAVGVWGGVQVVLTGNQLLLWAGAVGLATSALLLNRMARVGARAAVRAAPPVARPVATVQDVALETQPRQWAPRSIPRPLTASAGSQAAAVLDGEAARDALRRAALEEDIRQRADAQKPPSIDTARVARAAAGEGRNGDADAAPSAYSRMGYVDDAEIEAHVRELLARRAAG